jgi:hypothetical protein
MCRSRIDAIESQRSFANNSSGTAAAQFRENFKYPGDIGEVLLAFALPPPGVQRRPDLPRCGQPE